MTRTRFMTLASCLVIIFVFAKIYQHNQIVKLRYRVQRVEREKEEQNKRKNDLQVELAQVQSLRRVQAIAQEKLGMAPLNAKQLVPFDALLTSSVTEKA